MEHDVRRSGPWALPALLPILLAALPVPAAPGGLVERVGLEVEVQPMLIVGGQAGSMAPRRIAIDPDAGGKLEFGLQWPDPGATSRLVLRGSGVAGPPDGEHVVTLEAEFTLPGGKTTRAKRVFRVREGATSLFEVYGTGGDRLTLGLRAERKVFGFERALKSVGLAVQFRLEVEGVRGQQSVALETNYLNTFIGEPVEYSFNRGAGDSAESLRLTLTPKRRSGDVVEVAIEVSGSLPGGGGNRLLLSRTETLFTSRGATSAIAVTSGEPPTGYRFRIAPEF
jgi:hypothetical protein